MVQRIVAWSARRHWIVISAALILALGAFAVPHRLGRDVIPDLSDPQIGVMAEWPGHPAPEVAREVTQVLATAVEGVVGSKAVRGSSMSGMAYINIIFDAGLDIEGRRRAVMARVAGASASLPAGVQARVGPAASATGWVFQYALYDPSGATSIKTLSRLDEGLFHFALATVPGVAEVAAVGDRMDQVLVGVNRDRLREKGLAFSDVVAAVQSALSGPDGIAPGTARLPRLCENCDKDLAGVPVSGDQRIRLHDVASVRTIEDIPMGFADFGGVPAVGGIVIARPDADLASLVESVKVILERGRQVLPSGLQLVPVYDRLSLATRVQRTLARAIAEEVVVVVLVVLIFMLHPRSAVVPLATLPAVLVLTFAGMWLFRVSATVMSLGGIGIALGLAVDADVVALEASHRSLEGLGSPSGSSLEDRRSKFREASARFAPAVVTSLVIAALSFLPTFVFEGETGRLLRPLAVTKTLVIASAVIVSLTLAPALRDVLLGGRVVPELANPITRAMVRLYRPFVAFALARPALTLAIALLSVVSCLPIIPRLGGEFLPRIDEGDLLYMPTTLPGVAPLQAREQLTRQDRALAKFAEVSTVFGKVGRAETATDPAPYSMIETTVGLRPRSEWPKMARARWYSRLAPDWMRGLLRLAWPEESPPTTADVIEQLDRAVQLPGWTGAWTAPARARMDMMSTGLRVPLGIRVFAADPRRLYAIAATLRAVATRVPGTRAVQDESLVDETWLAFDGDSDAAARLGVDPATVMRTARLATRGGQVGEVGSHGMLLPVRVGLDDDGTADGQADKLQAMTVRPTSGGDATGGGAEPVPMALLGRVARVDLPSVIRTEEGQPVAYLPITLEDGTDIPEYVARVQREIEVAKQRDELRLLPGERIEWGGEYDLMRAGERRLRWVIPLVLGSMVALLFAQFRSVPEAMLVVLSVPFALVGSVWSLFLSGYSLSAPVWVGVLSVLGLSMQTGVLMVVYIDDAFYRRVRQGLLRTREDIVAAHAEGTVMRLRPKLMTTATMAASLLPLLWADGAGSEIMRRVATPMLGGLVTSAFLTLEILPVLYTMWRYRQLSRALRLGVSIEAIVGVAPGWDRGGPVG